MKNSIFIFFKTIASDDEDFEVLFEIQNLVIKQKVKKNVRFMKYQKYYN